MFRVLIDPSQELVVAVLCWESPSSRITQVNYVASPLEKVIELAGSDAQTGSPNAETGSPNRDAFGLV